MEKKYIIAGMLGLLAIGFTTTSALEIKKPGIATPIYKAVFIGGQRNGNSTCGANKPTCVGSTSPICLDTCGGLRFNLPSAGGNILKISLGGVRNIFAGPLTTQDLPDGIINSLHIADGAVTQLKLNLNKVGGWGNSITLPTQAWVYKKSIISGKTFNTCEPGYVGVGLSGEIRVISGSIVSGQVVNCVKADWLKNDVPPYPTDGGSYALVQSGTTWVWVSSVLGVLGAEGGDTNWVYRSTSSSGEIGNRNVGNVGVGLTNPDAKLAVNESFQVLNGGVSQSEMMYCHKTDTWVDKSTYVEADCVVCPTYYTYNTETKRCVRTIVSFNDRGFGSTVGFPDCGTANGQTYNKRQDVPQNQLCANGGTPHINTGATNFPGEFKRFCSITDPNRRGEGSNTGTWYMEGEKCSLTLKKGLVDWPGYGDEYARCNSESEGKYRPTSSGSILSGVACYNGSPYGLIQHSGGAWTWACLGPDKDTSDFTCRSRDSTNDGNPLGLCNSTLEEHFVDFNAEDGGYLTPSEYNQLLNTTPQGYTGNFVNILNGWMGNIFYIWNGSERTEEIPVGNTRNVYHQGLVKNFYVWSGNYYSGTKTITGITGAKLCNKGVASPVFASNHYGDTRVPKNFWMCTDGGVTELCKQESHTQSYPSTPMCNDVKETFYNDGNRCISGYPYRIYPGIDTCRANYDNDGNYENDYFVPCDFNKREYPVCSGNGTNEKTGEVLKKTPNTNQGWGGCRSTSSYFDPNYRYVECDYNIYLTLLEPGYWPYDPNQTSGWTSIRTTLSNYNSGGEFESYCKSSTNKWYARRRISEYPYYRDFEGGNCYIKSGGDAEESCQDPYAVCDGRTVPTRKIGTRYCIGESTTSYYDATPTVCSLSDPLIAGPCYQPAIAAKPTILIKEGRVAINANDIDRESGSVTTTTSTSCRTSGDCGGSACNGYIPASNSAGSCVGTYLSGNPSKYCKTETIWSEGDFDGNLRGCHPDNVDSGVDYAFTSNTCTTTYDCPGSLNTSSSSYSDYRAGGVCLFTSNTTVVGCEYKTPPTTLSCSGLSQSTCTPTGCSWNAGTTTPEKLGTCSTTTTSTTPPAALLVNGTVRAATLINYSDAGIKTNIEKIDNALANITKLNGYEFTWRDSGQPDFGVLAQEVEQVYATMVSTDSNGTKAVAYSELLAPIIEAIRDINTRIDELTIQAQQQAARLDTLEK